MLIYYISGIIVLPGLLLAIYAQSKVSHAYNRYSAMRTSLGITAREFTRAALDRAGLTDIEITKTKGHMTDYYDHRNRRLALSEGVYNSSSVAALSIAAHELGHALQYADKMYVPIRLRAVLVRVVNATSKMMWPLVIGGMLISFFLPVMLFGNTLLGDVILYAGVAVYGVTLILSLVTLPTETNASRRAIRILSDGGILNSDETEGAKKVLNAAALTYLASLAVSFLQLLRILFIILHFRRRD